MRNQHKITFRKSGAEVKAAVKNRLTELELRWNKRNTALDEFLADKTLVRSYLVRLAAKRFRHADHSLSGKEEIASEQMEEIHKICERIHQLEQEIHRLKMVEKHLDESQNFDLSYDELIAYGFNLD